MWAAAADAISLAGDLSVAPASGPVTSATVLRHHPCQVCGPCSLTALLLLRKQEERQVPADPQTEQTDFGCEFACRPLSSAPTIVITIT